MTETLRVDTELVQKSGGKLQSIARDLPEPPASYSPTGGDALSAAIAQKVTEVVDPVLTQMPIAKEELSRYAQKVVNAANTYEAVDRQIADEILKRLGLFEEAAAGGSPTGGAPSAGGGGSGASAAAGGATAPVMGTGPAAGGVQQVSAGAQQASAGAQQAGQMMQMPMQMAQQAAQAPMQMGGMLGAVPQALQQVAQQAMQQAGQLSEMVGSDEDKAAVEGTPTEEPKHEQAAAGFDAAERMPETLAEKGTEPGGSEDRPEIAL